MLVVVVVVAEVVRFSNLIFPICTAIELTIRVVGGLGYLQNGWDVTFAMRTDTL